MVVSFTPNIGLAKPSEAELASDWTGNTKLLEDNNLQIIDKMDIGLQTRVPTTVIAQTTNPNLGAGAATCEFVDIQGIVMGSFKVTFVDPGITAGSGEYGIELPFELDASFHAVGSALNAAPGQYSVIGNGYIYDSSAVATSGAVAIDAVTISPGSGKSFARLITEVFTAPGKTSRLVTHAQPFTPANGDTLEGFFIFKKD